MMHQLGNGILELNCRKPNTSILPMSVARFYVDNTWYGQILERRMQISQVHNAGGMDLCRGTSTLAEERE
jgi:hypothetical protein